jgi:hypothetical protein
MAKSNNNHPIFFAQNCLVDSVTAVEMGQHVTHFERISMPQSRYYKPVTEIVTLRARPVQSKMSPSKPDAANSLVRPHTIRTFSVVKFEL